MDRNYVNQFKKIPVYTMGLITFHQFVSGHEKVKDRLLRIMLQMVASEREGMQMDRMLIKHTVSLSCSFLVTLRTSERFCCLEMVPVSS